MNMEFTIESQNGKGVENINTLTLVFASGLRMTIDRERTVTSEPNVNKYYKVTWHKVYLWAINGVNLFDNQTAYLNTRMFMLTMLDKITEVIVNYDDEAEEDSDVKVIPNFRFES